MIPALMLMLICLDPSAVMEGDFSSCTVLEAQMVTTTPPEPEPAVEPAPACDPEKEQCA